MFFWFASVYAFIGVVVGKMIGVNSVIVVAGVDVAKERDLDYGIWLSPWRAPLVRYALRNAARVLVVDPSLKERAIRLAEYDGKNILYIPTGYDCHAWKPIEEKERVVLTVAVARDKRTFLRKGIDVLSAAAKGLPDVQFIVVGVDPKLSTEEKPPSNMSFHPAVRREELLPFYRQAKVFCQPSRFEGLPNTLCEAMMCECVPVATEVGGNPTAVGDAGILIPPNDPESLRTALLKAMNMPESVGAKARARIVSLFPKEKREHELIRLIESLIA